MIEDEIVELKPTTIAYLSARPELAPRRFVYSGQAMIVSPHSGANYLSFRDAIRELERINQDVRVDIMPTCFDFETFFKRTVSVHQYVVDESLVVLHEKNLRDLFNPLPNCTKEEVTKWFEKLKKEIPQDKKLLTREHTYIVLSRLNSGRGLHDTLNAVQELLGKKIELRSERTGLRKKFFKEELPSMPIEVFIMLVNQTTYFEREIVQVLLDERKERVLLAPRNADKIEVLAKLERLYSFQRIENSEAAIKIVKKVMEVESWKALRESYKEIALVTSENMDKLVRDAQNKFRTQMELLRVSDRIRVLLKDSPFGVFLFCKVHTVKECIRIFRMYLEKVQVRPPVPPVVPKSDQVSPLKSIKVKPPPPKIQAVVEQPPQAKPILNTNPTLVQRPVHYENPKVNPTTPTTENEKEHILIKLSKKVFKSFNSPAGSEDILELQERYGVQIEFFSSSYEYTREQIKDAKLYYRLLRTEKAELKDNKLPLRTFYLYTALSSKGYRDPLVYEIDNLKSKIEESGEIVEQEKSVGEDINRRFDPQNRIRLAKEQSDPEYPLLEIETSIIQPLPREEENQHDRSALIDLLDLQADSDDFRDDIPSVANDSRSGYVPSVQEPVMKDLEEPSNPFEMEEVYEFPFLFIIEKNCDKYQQFCKREGLKLEILNQEKLRVKGGQTQYERLVTKIMDDNRTWREIEVAKRSPPIKQASFMDLDDIELRIGENLKDCFKFFNADHIARWSQNVLSLTQVNKNVEFQWVYMLGDSKWRNEMVEVGGIKGMMGKVSIEVYTDLRQLRQRAKGEYIALCKAIRCRTLTQTEKLKENAQNCQLSYRIVNHVLPVYIGKLPPA